jgi:hypothetical protein
MIKFFRLQQITYLRKSEFGKLDNYIKWILWIGRTSVLDTERPMATFVAIIKTVLGVPLRLLPMRI